MAMSRRNTVVVVLLVTTVTVGMLVAAVLLLAIPKGLLPGGRNAYHAATTTERIHDQKETTRLDCLYILEITDCLWDVGFQLNDQPALHISRLSCGAEVTQFIRNGRNKARIVVKRFPDTGRSSCEVRLMAVRSLNTEQNNEGMKVGGLTIPTDDARQEHMVEFEFSANVPVTWVWERADDLKGLSNEDRTSIGKLVEGLAKAYTTRDPQAGFDYCLKWQLGSQSLLSPMRVHNISHDLSWVQMVMEHKNYGITIASPDSIHFAVGSRMVRLYREPDGFSHRFPLIRVGLPEGSQEPGLREFQDETLYCVKQSGKWHLLLENWY